MAQVKFYRGIKDNYNEVTHKDCIYFATDSHQIIMEGVTYGVTPEAEVVLKNAITKVEWISPSILNFTCGNTDKEHAHVNVEIPNANETTQGFMSAEQVVKLKGIEEGAQVNVIETITIDGVDAKISNKHASITGFAKADNVYTKDETYKKEEIDQKLVSVLEYKGTKNTYEELLSIENPQKGDVYNVLEGHGSIPAGTNWAYNEESWDALGGELDLSPVTKRIDTLETQVGKAASEGVEATGLFKAIADEVDRATSAEQTINNKLGESNADAGTETAFARIKQLEDDIDSLTGGAGSVATQIQNAINGLKGDAAEDYNTLGKLEDAILAEAKTRKDNDDAILQKIEELDGDLQGQIDGIDTTIDNLQSKDSELTKAIEDEATTRAAEDGKLANRISTLEGYFTDEGDGTVADQISDAVDSLKSTIDAYTVNGKAISTNPILGGGDIALTDYNVAKGGFITATDTVNAAISKLENDLIWHET